MRRPVLRAAAAALLLLSVPLLAPAQGAGAPDAFPAHALRLVVPLPPGGPSDFIARQVAQQLGAALAQPVVVDNRPGASGLVAAREVAAAPADGYTLLYAAGSMVAAPLFAKGTHFDWQRELAPLGKVGRVPFGLAVHPQVPASTLAELVAHARSQPGALNVATSTPSEVMAAAQFMQATGTKLARIPYKGGAQALPDLLAGRVQLMFGPLSLVQPHARSGALRVLAVLGPQRSPSLPEVPTLREAGIAGVDVPTWQALFAPARAPAAVRAKLAAATAAAVARPEMKGEFERRMLAVESATPQELEATIRQELADWAALIADYRLAEE